MHLPPLRRNRDFVLLQTGQALSTVGSESAAVAYTLLVLALTHSPAKAGLAGFARLVPWVLFALPAGVAVDRWNRKRLMIVADVVRAVALASLGVSALAGTLTFGQVPAVAFVEGAMYVLFNIAEIGAVRSVGAEPAAPACVRDGAGPTERGLPRGTAARRVPVRARSVAALSRRRDLVCVLDGDAAGDAHAVPGGTRGARNRGNVDTDPRGSRLAVGPHLPAHLRPALRRDELRV